MSYKINKPKIVAEVGACHLGQMERAKDLAKLAKLCNADYVKFQKRNPDESTLEHMKHKPHPNQKFAYGETYLEHRRNLELTAEQHAELKDFCEHIGIGYSTSVWDMTSAVEVVGMEPDFIKIPSACNQHWYMLNYIADNYNGDIHISTGMTTLEEMHDLYKWINQPLIKSRVVFYHCTSNYPCDFEDLNLLEIKSLYSRYKDSPIRLGFSNHGKGVAADIAAYTLGAEWIERHFIDDRLIEHTDAAASLEPNGLSRLVRDLNAVYVAMTKRPKELGEKEIKQRNKLKIHKKEEMNGE